MNRTLANIFKEKLTHYKNGITVIDKAGSEKYIEYTKLFYISIKILFNLQSKGFKKGDEVIIQIDEEERFIYFSWACILGGFVLVPLNYSNNDESIKHLTRIWTILENPRLISTHEQVEKIIDALDEKNESLKQEIKENSFIEDELMEGNQNGELACTSVKDTAFIVFSSGSTGDPKGIVLTNEKVISAIEDMKIHLSVNDSDVFLNWMPLTHVIGLVLFHVLPLIYDKQQVIMSKKLFIERPSVWLEKSDKYKATILVSPNIGFKQVLNDFDSKSANLDLSNVKIIMASAEPVSAELVEEFTTTMSKYNLKKDVLSNLYGMSESVLGIACTLPSEKLRFDCIDRNYISVGDKVRYVESIDENGSKFVNSGRTLKNCTVRICDDFGNELGEGYIGHVHITGRNIIDRYYSKEDTEKSFTEDGWLITGDIGFTKDNTITITGRSKDMLIVNGENFYASDIERIVETIEGIEFGKVAACGIFDETIKSEKAVIFVENNEEVDNFINIYFKIKNILSYKMGLGLIEIIPVPQIFKTNSGKVQRYKLAKEYKLGNYKENINNLADCINKYLSENVSSTAETTLQKIILKICTDVLRYPNIGIDDNLFDYGLHSLTMASIITEVRKKLNYNLTFSDFNTSQSIRELEKIIKNSDNSKEIEQVPQYSSKPEDLYKEFPLTGIQEAYFIGRSEDVEMGGVCTHFYQEIETKYDISIINKSLQKLINIYPMMRAIITKEKEQKILENVPEYKIEEVDLTNVSKDEQKELINKERKRMSHYVFATDKWPLFEFKSFKLSDEKNYLFVSYDLIIADAASVLEIGRNLVDLCNNPNMELEVPDFSFRDYVTSYEKFKKSNLYKNDYEFWQEKINDFPDSPELPYKQDVKNIKKPFYKRVKKVFDANEWGKIKSIAKTKRITASTVLCTLFMQILSNWSNQKNFAISLTSFNSVPFNKDADKIIGDFTSVLPLQAHFEENETFWDKTEKIQSELMEILEHRNYDGLSVIRDIARKKNLGIGKIVMPIVFSSILFDEGRFGWSELGDIKFSVSQTPQVFIDVQVMEDNGKLSITWDYVDQLFDEKIINQMFDQYTNMISGVASDNLEMSQHVTDEDKALIEMYNSTDEDIAERTLHEMFVEQATLHPENIAVMYKDESITYSQLDKKSNQIARYLIEKGISRGEYVGVLAYRKIETIANMLGILKAGAAYIPLNPDHPQERRQYILDNAKAKLELNPESYKNKEMFNYDDISLGELNDLNDSAYVIYTSGSTGRPKGVVISHKAAANTIQDINNKFNVNEDDRIIGLSSMCFDLSVYDIFGALSSGAALVMIDDQRDVKNITEVIEKYKITIWNSVPAIMDMLLSNMSIEDDEVEINYRKSSDDELMIDYSDFSSGDSLRLVLLSGDWLPLSLPDRIKSQFENSEVISLGGATEASIWSIYYPIEDVDPEWKSIPYGIPLANQKFYVLNYNKELCPAEVPGEMYIGGCGVAKGYMNDKEKTEKAFIEHPVLGRLYATGDYGVLHEKGYIEFLGRKDQQVKIRGYRIELGEIENCILDYDGIVNAVVVDKTHESGKQYLCAYMVAKQDIAVSNVKEYLQGMLPDYMIPSYFVIIDEIPLTANGKVNRKALPEPEEGIELNVVYVEPKTEMEIKLAEMWKELLNISKVGITNNFFDLGGNSVLMVQMINAISKKFKVNINFRELLDYNTISGLAILIESKEPAKEDKVIYPQIIPDTENINKPFPLTGIQMAYLMGRDDKYELGGVSTHVYTEYETKFEPERFNNSINKVISRHPMLRAIILPNGQQKVLDEIPKYEMEVIDLRNESIETQQEYILKERKLKSHTIFKTDVWPLFEFKMLRLTDDVNYLFFGLDMLIADGASILMIYNEIAKYYNNPDFEPKEIKCTFRDYMIAYNEFKNSDVYKNDKEYWLNQIDTFPQAPALPYKVEPHTVKEPRFRRCDTIFNKEEWEKIKEKAKENRVTPATVLCTAYAEVLGYWSNQDRVAINSTVFNRYPFHEDVNSIIGDFTSVMLLGIDLKQGKTFWEKARNVQKVLAEALEHRHYDGIEFIRELTKYYNFGNKAVMPIVFTSMLFGNTLEVGEKGTDTLGKMKMSVSQTSQVFIDQQIIEVDGGITITWDYVEQLLDSNMMNQMFEQYISIIKASTENTEKQLLTITDEDKKFIDDYNDTNKDMKERTLHEIFVEQAERTPDNLAVIYKDESITYSELDKKSNQIARYLIDNGISRGEYVGVLAYRKIETIVNMMGILKAGAAYIPLNPDHPEERRRYILENANSKMQLEPETYCQKKVCEYSDLKIEDNIYPSDSAYVIYTSGSTGKPKGVVVSHKAAANTILDINNKFNVNEDDRIIGLSSMCFDLSVYDIFGSLSSGAALVMIDDQRDVKDINNTMKKNGVTVWNSVPAIMDMLLDNIGLEEEVEIDYRQSLDSEEVAVDYAECYDDESLRVVLLSGDWLPVSLPERIKNQFPNSEVISLGGATEAAIWSIYYPIEEVNPEWKSIPYGMPLTNQQFYVLNYEYEMCPVGVTGELYIGGLGVAEGYMNDKEKTEKAFIDHPKFGRIYSTGDYGVLCKEGYIEFLGRKDQQVKIRGYRIELGEIENCILDYDGVVNAVVVDKTHESGKKYLCAYIVGKQKISITELKEYLQGMLPDYMVPSYFVMIDEIPLTANGKVNRKVLPEPTDSFELNSVYIEPKNEIERSLASIWEGILKINKIGTTENFFDLGGNSVLMVQMITKISRQFKIDISFRELLEHNTIGKLATLLEMKDVSVKEEVIYPEIIPDTENINEPFPLTGIQMAYLMGRGKEFEMGGTSTHVYTEYETELNPDRFNESINKVISRHPMMRAIILSNGQQKILSDVPEYKMEIIDLRNMDSKSQEEYIVKEREIKSHQIFKTDVWPLFEFKMLKLTDEKNYLFFGLDMLIADGASILMMLNEVMKYYNNPELNLPELKCTFRDYMLAYNNFKNSDVYKADKKYWLSKLETFPQSPVLPYKVDPSQVSNPHFERCEKTFTKEQWEAIKKKSQENRITSAALLCTAYAQVLGYWSNQDRVAINSTVFNRYPFHKDINSIIGDFTSVMLLGIDLKEGKTFWDKTKYVQRVFAEALEHRHYDGVEFIRELSKYNDIGNKAVMPIVFTSMLFGNTLDVGERGTNTLGEVKMSVSQTSQVFIDQQIVEVDGGIRITWDYVEQLFDKNIMQSMFEQYIGILENCINDSEYKLNPTDEDLNIINEYNSTEKEQKEFILHDMFCKQAEKTPENIAVMFEEESITYKELDEKSNQVANYMIENGVEKNDYVGVIVERCIDTIVNILGVLKAGAAYVAISPEYPEERKTYILEHSKCRMLLLPEIFEEKNIAKYSKDKISMNYSPDDVAYVIYTSGSTGTPKGVIITHKAAANTIIDINDKFDVNEEDRIIGLSSMCFDLSVYDIFGSLTSGAALVMIEDQRDIKNIKKIIKEKHISIWNSVPAIIDMLIDNMSEDEEELGYWSHYTADRLIESDLESSLRLVLLSGDWIPLALPEKIKDKFMNAEVISLGGATEASIWSIYYPIDEIDESWTSIPYGMPLANQKFYTLNYDKEICPIGVMGELYIGGTGVAQGYMNDEEKTKNAFIDHPKLGRLYNTGDYGVMHKEGYIEFLGRKDYQVKIQGYRVELGEIENRLNTHPHVRNAVVIDKSKKNGKKYLCAYIVADKSIEREELKTYLEETLPEYMVPSYFVMLDNIPLTANGKVNRKELPEPGASSLETGVKYVAPTNEIEAELVELWRELLEVDQVGINDNFFDLGGNSVLLVKMHSKIDLKYPNKIKIVEMFSNPTISKLVKFLDDKDKNENTKIKVNTMKMPAEFFFVDNDEEEESYELSLDKDILDKLDIISKQENVERYDILFALYINLISQISENSKVDLQTLVKENYIGTLEMDLEDVEDFSLLVQNIKNDISEIENKELFAVNKLKSDVYSKNDESASLLFYKEALLTESVYLNSFYDVVIGIDDSDDNITINYSFNRFKISGRRAKELLKQYKEIITLLVENY